MKSSTLLLLLSPLLAYAQSSQSNGPQLTTIATTITKIGQDHQQTVVTSNVVLTLSTTAAPSGSQPSGSGSGSAGPSGSASGNNTISGSGSGSPSASGNTTSSTTTTSSNAPTAGTSGVNGGGGQNGAPMPGQTGSSGQVYGPDDDYIGAASTLHQAVFAVTVGGVLLGGFMAAA